jgi:glucose-1-phosphatase
MQIKNIVFDFGGVLLDLAPEKSFTALAKLMGGDEGVAQEMYVKHAALFDNYESGKLIMENFLWNLQNMCKEVPDITDVINAWNAMLLGWNLDKLALLKDLKSKYNVYLLSNTNEIHLNWVRRDLRRNHHVVDFEKVFFHKAYYSHELGMRKPNKDIFEFVISDAGIVPSETVFIDDNAANIETAKTLGFNAFLFETNAPLDLDNIIASFN